MTDRYLFADEPTETPEALNERWKILIVDDEPEVHAVTRLALSDFQFLGRGLEFYSAESGEAGCALMREHPDAAIILLDVVMETDDAGLKVARYIREELDNHFIRIILRTGQPGQAPERTVIINYDINDYKSKTELTAQKLFTAVMSSLRSYRDIMSIEHSRRGLEKILQSSADLFSEQSIDNFVDGLVQQLSWLIGGARQVLYAEVDPDHNPGQFTVRAAFGEEADIMVGRPIKAGLPVEALSELEQVVRTRRPFFSDDIAIVYSLSGARPLGGLLCLSGLARQLNRQERDLLTLFADQIQLALNNVLRERDANHFVAQLSERLLVLEQNALYRDDVNQHPAAKTSLVLSDALGLTNAEQEHTALASTLMALISGICEVTLAQEALEVRVCYERMHRIAKGIEVDSNPVVKVLLIGIDERFERFDGEGFPGLVQAEEFSLNSQVISLISIIYGEISAGRGVEATLKALLAETEGRFAPGLVSALRSNFSTIADCFNVQA
ncbi:response regulator [Aliidiomarina iranensis]|uniref:Response regulator n=1 Tax=Aliidiomarina iranensis TaxID=1434071 RepID=A0A432VX32_9GAMM|nr:response regulator [Aliidiomarina iranensis]RUO21232.1 response regulator [Aliidiomarina iranensis]